jgi:hypothetical protein
MNAPAEGARIEAELLALQDGAVPVKTARGREELSQRRGALRPRLRSLLLLADGQRSLANLRSMAVQTGGTLLDVDELLRGGYIELPAPASPSASAVLPVLVHEPMSAAATAAAAPAAAVEPRRAASTPPPPVATARPSPSAGRGAAKSSAPAVSAAPVAAPVATPVATPQPAVEAHSAAATVAPTGQHAMPAPVQQPPSNEPDAHAPLHGSATSPSVHTSAYAHAHPQAQAQTAEPAPVPAPDNPPAAEAGAALSTARALLRDWLALDGPRGNGRLRSLQSRIEHAPDIDALVALLEEAESQIPATRRSHQARLRIAQLRDVLGLGNTRTAEDTQPGASADEAGAWAPTLPGQ